MPTAPAAPARPDLDAPAHWSIPDLLDALAARLSFRFTTVDELVGWSHGAPVYHATRVAEVDACRVTADLTAWWRAPKADVLPVHAWRTIALPDPGDAGAAPVEAEVHARLIGDAMPFLLTNDGRLLATFDVWAEAA